MKTKFKELKETLHEISEIHRECVKDLKGDYIDINKRTLKLNSNDLEEWYALNMKASSIVDTIIYKLKNII